MNNLYIINDSSFKTDKDGGYFYFLDKIPDSSKNLNIVNNSKAINDYALKIKSEYIDYINSLNKYFLEHRIIYENSISMFFFSDLFNKRTEKFKTYISICHILYLKDYLDKNRNIKKVIAVGCTAEFNSALNSILNKIKIETYRTKKDWNFYLKYHLSQFRFFFSSIIKLILIKINYKKNKVTSGNKLYLSRYPLHFDKNFIEDKYVNLIKENDMYLISLITDGMHQNIKLKNIIKHTKRLNNENNVILLDSYLKITDLVKGLLNHLYLITKVNKLCKNKYSFKDIDITKFMNIELNNSFRRIPRLLCYTGAIKKVFSLKKFNEFIFHLHEYSYGRYFNYILAKYFPQVKRIGFQHGPVARRKLLYYMGKDIVSNIPSEWLYKTPIPDSVLCEDEFSKNIYIKSGYNNIQIMNNIYRLNYLKDIIRKNIDDNLVLIVPGLHDGLYLLNKVSSYIEDNPDKKYILKPHPRSNIFKMGIPDKYNYDNLVIGNNHISHYLEKVSNVIVTYSSVGYEAYMLNIPVLLVMLPNTINESPLLDYYESNQREGIEISW